MLGYRLDLLARVLEARLDGSGDGSVVRVCTDSRQVQEGDLFFALSGENFDAHQFVPDVLAKGAIGAVVGRDRVPRKVAGAKGALLEVEDPLLALGQLGAWHRNRFSVRVVAVTGSVGKTTTKDLVAGVLSQQFRTLKNEGNLNTEIGVPLTLLELRRDHEALVVELGMRGPGQIRYLARLARPDVALITTIGLSHMELLGSQDAIADAKAEILDFLPEDGTAVLPADEKYSDFLRQRVPPGARVVPFGTERVPSGGITGAYLGPGARANTRNGDAPTGTRFTLRAIGSTNVRWVWIPLPGRHNMRNALAAAAAGHALGVSWPRICRGLGDAEISRMRMAVHRLRDGSTLVDDAYNASSPEAMLSALEVLKELPGLRKVAVLGSMLELGPASEEAHRRVGEGVASVDPSLLITVGEGGRRIAEGAREAGYPEDRTLACEDNAEALERIQARRRAGDVILVKGSRGVAMEAIVRELRGSEEA